MSFDIDADAQYLESHEWLRLDGDTARIGISDFAQDELGDIVFVELPELGEAIVQDEAFGVVESIKAVSDLYAPASGQVIDRNEELESAPELLNEDPFGEGWLLEIDLEDEAELEALLRAEKYDDQIA